MPAMLLRPWIGRVLVASSLATLSPAMVLAGWPWTRPAPAVATPVGPPIYTPSAAATVTNYQPAYVPAAIAPTLVGPPTTYTPAPAVGVAPAYAAPAYAAPAVAAPSCGTCGVAPRVTGY